MSDHDTCDYAACTARATHSDDAWDFCLQHYREHRADLHGEQWPKLDTLGAHLLIKEALRPGHGTPARYRRHLRDGEPACQFCAAAETARINPTGATRRDHRYARRAS